MTPAAPMTDRSPDAWFRRRPSFTWSVVVALFAGIFALRILTSRVEDAYSVLYVFPVALVAVAFGRRPGTVAGIVAVLLIIAWVVIEDVNLSPAGWLSRMLPILLLGLLVGDATDRMRRIESERRRLESAALLHREAIEINDSLVQGMVAAKWSLEAGNLDTGLDTLNATINQAHELVSGLIRQAGMGERAQQLGREE